jgi:DNA primase
MAFTPAFLDELRARFNLSDVVGRRVRLIRRGREHTGLCPFHNEKTPSFTVSDDKGFYHCFGCGEHGDVVGFVMKTENMTFPEAVERLAEEAGMPLPKQAPEDHARAKAELSLFAVTEAAGKWFEEQFKAPAGRNARDYLVRRGVDPRAIAKFRLGFAPDSRGALKSALAAQGFPESLMITAGLLVVPEDGRGAYDRFRGRVMFPIEDPRGRVVAFGGRILGDGEPKYLNSPETPLFHKGRLLYGLRHARDILRAPKNPQAPDAPEPQLLVVEGYMDAIAALSVGIAAVAPLGTALGEDQIQLLWRLVSEPVLCFDGDAAGMRAAARAADRGVPLVKPGFSLSFANLPKGEDPDTLVRRAGRGALQEVMSRARPLAEMLFDVATTGRPVDTPERRAAVEKVLADIAARIQDKVVREHYGRYFKRRLWEAFGDYQSPVGLRVERGMPRRSSGNAGTPSARVTPQLDRLGGGSRGKVEARERVLLLTVLNHPAIIPEVAEELSSATIDSPELDALRAALLDIAGHNPDLDSTEVRRHVSDRGFGATVSRLSARETFDLEGFAGPGVADDEALAGFRRVLAYHRRIGQLRADLEAMQQDLVRELERDSPAAAEVWARVQALMQTVSSEGEPEDDEEILGPVNGDGG